MIENETERQARKTIPSWRQSEIATPPAPNHSAIAVQQTKVTKASNSNPPGAQLESLNFLDGTFKSALLNLSVADSDFQRGRCSWEAGDESRTNEVHLQNLFPAQ